MCQSVHAGPRPRPGQRGQPQPDGRQQQHEQHAHDEGEGPAEVRDVGEGGRGGLQQSPGTTVGTE